MPDPHRFLITGCGCSGTKAVARILTALGLDCGHEAVFRPDVRRPWVRPGESSWLAIPHLGDPRMANAPKVRIIRDPFDVVNSAIADGFLVHNRRGVRDPFAEYVFGHQTSVGDIDDSVHQEHGHPNAARSILWATGWDRPAAHLPTFRIEDDDAIPGILEALGTSRSTAAISQARVRVGSPNTHHRGHTRRYTRREIRAMPGGELVAARAAEYGYRIDD